MKAYILFFTLATLSLGKSQQFMLQKSDHEKAPVNNYTVYDYVAPYIDFGRGFVSGFVNQDLSNALNCSSAATNFTHKMEKFYHEATVVYKNDTKKKQNSTREILHIIENLPEDFESCTEITNFCGELGKRIITIIDITDWPVRVAKNSLMHSFELTRHFIEAGKQMGQKHYYRGGWELGRAFDVLIGA